MNLVLDMYAVRKEVREFLEYRVSPKDEVWLKKYKDIIRAEFYPDDNVFEPQLRFSVCRKAVSDFKKMNPSADALAELMIYYMECAFQFSYQLGPMWEQYYTSVANNFNRTLQHIVANGLWDKYEGRLEQCVKWASNGAYDFEEIIPQLYEEARMEAKGT